MNNKFTSFLGICQKARKLSIGFDVVAESIEKGKASLVLVASDLSNNTKGKIVSKCKRYNVEYIEIDSSIEDIYKVLGKCSGIISVLDLKCSEKIRSLLDINSLGGNSNDGKI